MEVKRYKAGTLKGELTTAEIRKLIRAHNKASSIKIPPKSTREDIIGILQKAGYVVNHEKAELRPAPKGKVQKLKVISQQTIAQELPKPKPLTEEQKKQRQQAKQKKAGEKAFLKAVIPKPPSVSKPSKGVKVGKPPPKKEEPKKEEPTKLNEIEKNRCIKAVNNARSVIDLYEKKEGNIKDSAFSSKKDLMETIKDLNDVRQNLKLCPKTEQDIVDKALSLHSKGLTPKKKEPKKEEPKAEPKKEGELIKKGEPYIISKIKDSNAKIYDYNFTKEKDIVQWFNNWKRDRRTLIRELKEALSKGKVTKEDLKPIEPINITRTKRYKIREGQIFRAIKEQGE